MDITEVVEDILSHHGTLGMKWGHRKASDSSAGSSRKERRAAKRVAKQDKKFEKIGTNKGTQYEIKRHAHNTIGPMVQSKVYQLNAKPEYSKAIAEGRFKNPNDPVAKKYVKEYNKMYIDTMNDYLKGYSNASGTKVARAHLNSESFNGFDIRVENASRIKHEDSLIIRINYIKDDKGRIIGVEVVNDELAQSAIDNILSHHGVKGMHWGVRTSASSRVQSVKDARARSRSSKVTVVDKKRRIKTSGGAGHPAHSDAIGKATTGQILKKSGAKSLSNAQLKAYNERMNLEANARKLSTNDMSSGKRFILKTLKKTGEETTQDVAKQTASKMVKKHLIKTAVVAAV
jgi:hypothetical protein